MQSAEGGSFSAAARRLGLTPAAVSKNVARLEVRLGVRLFQRSTRRLTLTEGGERFLAQIGGALATLQEAVAGIAKDDGQPAGTLKVSLGQAFGREHVLPMMGDFLARYPSILPDWHFDNQQVDLVGEGFDAAIGGGIELSPGVVARELSRIHVVAVASPAYLAGRKLPAQPADLAQLDALLHRSSPTGRLRSWTLQHANGQQTTVELPRPRAIFTTPRPSRRPRCWAWARPCCRCLLSSEAFAAANWCDCCPSGISMRGWCGFTTRARSCCRRRRACSSISCWNAFAASGSRSGCKWPETLRHRGLHSRRGGRFACKKTRMNLSFKTNRRAALAASAAAAVALMAPTAWAQNTWPTKPVRIVVPFAASGTTDILARAVAPELSKAFGQQFIVDNRAGAGGNVGAEIVARAPNDGYTLLMGTVGTHGINRALYPKLPFDPIKDFVPITLVAAVPNVMEMNAEKAKSLNIHNVQDFIKYTKANPGKLNRRRAAAAPRSISRANSSRA